MNAQESPTSPHCGPDDTARLFHALSEPSRLALLEHLMLGEHRVVDLVEHLGLAQSTVSQHLACLRECGLITSRPVGRASLHAVADPDGIRHLIDAAHRILERSGHAAASHSLNHGEVSTDSVSSPTGVGR